MLEAFGNEVILDNLENLPTLFSVPLALAGLILAGLEPAIFGSEDQCLIH